MNAEDLITAAEAAEMLKMSVNAFRIFVHRHGKSLTKHKIGGRRIYFFRSELLSLLVIVEK